MQISGLALNYKNLYYLKKNLNFIAQSIDMRIVPFIISAALTTGLVAVLNTPLSVGKTKTPRLGYFLSPQQGFWQNAEPENKSFDAI